MVVDQLKRDSEVKPVLFEHLARVGVETTRTRARIHRPAEQGRSLTLDDLHVCPHARIDAAAVLELEEQVSDLKVRLACLTEYNAALEKEIEKLGGDKAAMQKKRRRMTPA